MSVHSMLHGMAATAAEIQNKYSIDAQKMPSRAEDFLAQINANNKGKQWLKFLSQYDDKKFLSTHREEALAALIRIHDQVERDPSIFSRMNAGLSAALARSIHKIGKYLDPKIEFPKIFSPNTHDAPGAAGGARNK